MKSNSGKCNLITSSTSPVEIQIEKTITFSVDRFKLQDVHIDPIPVFGYYVDKICEKAS